MNNCRKRIPGRGTENTKAGRWERDWYFVRLERRLVWLKYSDVRREMHD